MASPAHIPQPVFAGRAPCTKHTTVAPKLSPRVGAVGQVVTVSGVLPRNGQGQPGHPTIKLEAWWNLDQSRWFTALTSHPAAASQGRVFEVASTRVPKPNPCTFALSFRVPKIAAGRYDIVVVYFSTPLSAASFASTRFTVTS